MRFSCAGGIGGMPGDPGRHPGGPVMIPAARRGYWHCVKRFAVAVAPTDDGNRSLSSRALRMKLYIPCLGL